MTYDLIKTQLGHSVHNSQEMLLLPQFLRLFEDLVHMHRTASRIIISEILIRNQLALIKDELLCHSGLICIDIV